MNDDVNKSLEFEEKTLVELVEEVEEKTLVENNIATNTNESDEALTDVELSEKSTLSNREKIDIQEVKVINNGDVIEIINETVSKPEVKWDFPQRDFNDFFKKLGYDIELERTDIATEKIRYFVLKRNNERYFAKVSLNIPDLKTVREIHRVISKYPDNFVRVFEESISDDFYYEIREYCPDGDLYKNIPSIKNNVDEFIRQMNESLKILHDNSIVHLDIKPSNIILKNGRYLINDFEIANIVDKETGQSANIEKVGTEYFTAPEVKKLGGTRTIKADYWSLGMVIYYILTNKIPFSDTYMWENFFLSNPGYIPVDVLPKEFKKLVAGLLTLDYEERIGYEEVSSWLNGRDFDLSIQLSFSLFEFKNMGYNSLDQLIIAYCDDYDQALDHFINVLPQQLKENNLKETLQDLDEIMQNTNWDQHDKLAMFMFKNSENKLPVYCGEILTFETFTLSVERVLARKSGKYENYIIDNFRKVYNLFNEVEYEGNFSIVLSLYKKMPEIFVFDKLTQLHDILSKIRDSGIHNYKEILMNNTDELIDFIRKTDRGPRLYKLPDTENSIREPGIYVVTKPSTIEFSIRDGIKNNVFLVGERKMKISIRNSELENFDGVFSNLSFDDSKLRFKNSDVLFTNCDLRNKSTTIIAENSRIKFKKSVIQGKTQAMYLRKSKIELIDSQIISEKDGIFFEESEIKEINVKYQVKGNQKLEYKRFWG